MGSVFTSPPLNLENLTLEPTAEGPVLKSNKFIFPPIPLGAN